MMYSIGSNLDDRTIILLDKLCKKYNIKNSNIEIFLSYPMNSLSLDRSFVKDITLDNFYKHINIIKFFGFQINYVFNSPDFDDKHIDILKKELIMLKSLDINIITIGNINMLNHIDSHYKIVLSTVLNIDTISKLENILLNIKKIGNYFVIDRIIPSFKINKDIQLITEMVVFLRKIGIDLEILADQTCTINCKLSDTHYFMDKSENKNKFKCPYNINKFNYLDSNGSYIDPLFTKDYEDIGVKFFKLATRNKSFKALFYDVNDYFSRTIISDFDSRRGY